MSKLDEARDILNALQVLRNSRMECAVVCCWRWQIF